MCIGLENAVALSHERMKTKTSDRGDRGKMKRSKAQTMAKLDTTILLIVPKR